MQRRGKPPGDAAMQPGEDDARRSLRLLGLGEIQSAAHKIDAMVLGVELMLSDQRRLMRDTNASNYQLDNELWNGVDVLLNQVRSYAVEITELGEKVEVSDLQSGKAA